MDKLLIVQPVKAIYIVQQITLRIMVHMTTVISSSTSPYLTNN